MRDLKMEKRQRGFFTLAQNSEENDYVRMAYALALSLRASQRDVSWLSIGITPETIVEERYAWAFDNIVEIPWGDHAADSRWKLENEWKVIHMTPYEETIKLDADMLFFADIGSWWEHLADRDLACCNEVLDYKGHAVTSDYYRKTFTDNKLPNIYTACMYFKKTEATHELFDLVRYIYFNWQAFFEQLLEPATRPEYPSTDVIFALALKLLDLDGISYTTQAIPTFTHMKSQLQGWQQAAEIEDWTTVMDTFFNPQLECKIGNHLQQRPLHYHIKSWLTDEIIEYYERRVQR